MSVIFINPYRFGAVSAYDADAQSYITAVETADGEALETAVRDAINDFVVGCKADGIWTAIKASCILAGARTLAGALVPLVGAPPANVGPFVSGAYNRKTGLSGNNANYLDANRNHNIDPQNNRHLAVYATEKAVNASRALAGFTSALGRTRLFINAGNDLLTNCSDATNRVTAGSFTAGTGLFGISRSQSTSYNFAYGNNIASIAITSAVPDSGPYYIFSAPTNLASNPRLAFYSIGEYLDLAKLRTRITDLINAFAAAIP